MKSTLLFGRQERETANGISTIEQTKNDDENSNSSRVAAEEKRFSTPLKRHVMSVDEVTKVHSS